MWKISIFLLFENFFVILFLLITNVLKIIFGMFDKMFFLSISYGACMFLTLNT